MSFKRGKVLDTLIAMPIYCPDGALGCLNSRKQGSIIEAKNGREHEENHSLLLVARPCLGERPKARQSARLKIELKMNEPGPTSSDFLRQVGMLPTVLIAVARSAVN